MTVGKSVPPGTPAAPGSPAVPPGPSAGSEGGTKPAAQPAGPTAGPPRLPAHADDGVYPVGAVRPPAADSGWGKCADSDEEEIFLEGPHKRSFELFRAVRIFLEFIRGFRGLHFLGPCVTVFGSARFDEQHRYYQLAREMGRQLGRNGFTAPGG